MLTCKAEEAAVLIQYISQDIHVQCMMLQALKACFRTGIITAAHINPIVRLSNLVEKYQY